MSSGFRPLRAAGTGTRRVPVPLVEGALQVFSGTLLARWTGGRLHPGRHRVVAAGTVTAWRGGTPYVAELAADSAGRR
jgi:isopenicillin N synthase-like dioxygenase